MPFATHLQHRRAGPLDEASLRNAPLFRSLAPDLRHQIAAQSWWQACSKDEYLAPPVAGRSQALYVVDGMLTITIGTPSGGSIAPLVLGPAALFLPTELPASLNPLACPIALSDCTLINHIDNAVLQLAMATDCQFSAGVMANTQLHLQQITERLYDTALFNRITFLAHTLGRIALS